MAHTSRSINIGFVMEHSNVVCGPQQAFPHRQQLTHFAHHSARKVSEDAAWVDIQGFGYLRVVQNLPGQKPAELSGEHRAGGGRAPRGFAPTPGRRLPAVQPQVHF